MKTIYFLLLASAFSGIAYFMVGEDLRAFIDNAPPSDRLLVKPDLSTLAERSRPDYPRDGENTSLNELFYLIEYPDVKALPVLKQILHDNMGQTRGQFMYAVMAIHAIDTPESSAVLKESLSDPCHYGTTDGRIRQALFNYIRDQVDSKSLIKQYYLTTLSDEVGVVLEQEPVAEQDAHAVRLTYTLANTTDCALGLFGFEPKDAATAIWLRDSEGQLYPPYRLRAGYDNSPTYMRLDPSEPLTHDFTLRLVEKGGKYRAVSSHAFYSLPGPGEYEAFMLFERREMDAIDLGEVEQHGLGLPDGEKWWSGRVVSDPITIKFASP